MLTAKLLCKKMMIIHEFYIYQVYSPNPYNVNVRLYVFGVLGTYQMVKFTELKFNSNTLLLIFCPHIMGMGTGALNNFVEAQDS